MDLYANNMIEFDAEKTKQLAEKYRDALAILGENPEREGLFKTPERVAKAMQFFTQGYAQDPEALLRYARRLQVQERLTTQIKECIQKTLNPMGVMVIIEAQHLCMQMRGVQKQHSITTTSDFTGVFEQAKTREEFMNLIKG